MFDTPAFFTGLTLGFGIFVCPGPKDVLILRQALLGRSSVQLIAVGCISDALLIWLGMAGLSALFANVPFLQSAALWLGACLLVGHGVAAARSALRGASGKSAVSEPHNPTPETRGLAALLAVSFLNPVAWLDAVLIVGSVGAALPSPSQTSFGAGATVASLAWFVALVLGAQGVARWMQSPRAWRLLDALTAVAMWALAFSVAWGLT